MNLFILILIMLLTSCGFGEPGAGAVRVSEVDHMEMVFVPAGEFAMGRAEGDLRADPDEMPVHTVRLDSF